MRLIKDSKVTHQFLVKTLLAYHDQWNAPVAVGKMGHLVFFPQVCMAAGRVGCIIEVWIDYQYILLLHVYECSHYIVR